MFVRNKFPQIWKSGVEFAFFLNNPVEVLKFLWYYLFVCGKKLWKGRFRDESTKKAFAEHQGKS